MSVPECICPAGDGRATGPLHSTRQQDRRGVRLHSALFACLLFGLSSASIAQQPPSTLHASASAHPSLRTPRPPRVVEAEHFLALRGIAPGHRVPPRATVLLSRPQIASRNASAQPSSSATSPAAATWQPLGPTAVITPNYGLVSGRVSALALDPSDATGNRLYIGTTGGGVWSSSNAGTSTTSAIVFTPLTDNLAALGGAADASISIGALTVQPGGTGIILAGTGDPNDSLDSYYGAGILRSTDGGNTWELIATTDDTGQQLGSFNSSFVGNGFAGFAWSTLNPQLVVAAVSQAL